MNGNTPYAGSFDVTQAGKRAAADIPELSTRQKRAFKSSVSSIAARTRKFLPSEYVVGSEITRSATGPQATIAVQPPVGHPVSAGFQPDEEDLQNDPLISEEDLDEVARGLAASAALQVKQAVGDEITPTAR